MTKTPVLEKNNEFDIDNIADLDHYRYDFYHCYVWL